VGIDALAIYVHKNNPIKSITIAELSEIYGENGKINAWQDLGVNNAACRGGKIVKVSRQNSSGTYVYFKEHVLGKTRDYAQGIIAQSGSSDVVTLVAKTPCAIGYSGMGYSTDSVKMVPVAMKKGAKAVAPTVDTATDGSYPISRPLFLYTLGQPKGEVKKFIDWCLGEDGQLIVEDTGYVPMPKKGKVAKTGK
jgi:phosphate transport system substrate-binding protein